MSTSIDAEEISPVIALYMREFIRKVVREMEEEKKHADDWERRDVGEHCGL